MRDAAQTVLAWDLKSSSSRSVLLTSCFFAGRADLEQKQTKQTKGTKGRRGNRRWLSSPKPRAQELFSSFPSFPSVPWGCGQRPRWGVEPPLLAMRSNGRCSPQRPDLRLRDARHQLAFDDFIWPLALRPAREGSLDEFRRLTRQIQHADDLLGGGPRGCPARRSRSRSISQTLANRPRQLSIASLFDGTQRLPSRGPPSPPQADLMPLQADSQHNLLVGESLDGE